MNIKRFAKGFCRYVVHNLPQGAFHRLWSGPHFLARLSCKLPMTALGDWSGASGSSSPSITSQQGLLSFPNLPRNFSIHSGPPQSNRSEIFVCQFSFSSPTAHVSSSPTWAVIINYRPIAPLSAAHITANLAYRKGNRFSVGAGISAALLTQVGGRVVAVPGVCACVGRSRFNDSSGPIFSRCLLFVEMRFVVNVAQKRLPVIMCVPESWLWAEY